MTFPNRSSLIEFKSNDAPITKGEEFSNRSRGAKLGWLKRSRDFVGNTAKLGANTLGSAAMTLTRPDLVSAKKIEDLKRRASEDATFLTSEALTTGTLALLLLTKKGRKLTKNTLGRTARGAKGFVKEGFGDLPGEAFSQLRKKSPKLDNAVTLVEEVSPATKVVEKGYKDIKATINVAKKARSGVDEIIEASRNATIREGRKVTGRLKIEELEKTNPWAQNTSVWERLAWQGKRDRATIKSWTGFNRYSEEFWTNFEERKEINIEFSKSSKRRKPMSEATKRKISRSLAKSQGSSQGYEGDRSQRIGPIDGAIAKIGSLTKAIDPLLRYKSNQDRIKESKRRRSLAALNTGVNIASPAITYATRQGNLRQRLASADILSQRRSQDLMTANTIKDRISQRNERIQLIKAKAFDRQTAGQALRELRESKIPLSVTEARSLFRFK